ncbi:MAG: ATP-dependent helicase [Candidatus Omnitrophica bacterium]|nr:ATP-dependent helicase [Candidatus Omnitrophota bacterium]MBU4488416.1 ATP-dependent helicase [Candidatus Omnitrophota bacterium]MCG2704932.1 ATP-dependent helicase [Candidatus Omnitrophota bacterium]
MFDFKKHLNPSQYEAVTQTEGPLLVIAGAGSGKTRVIEYRVLHLVENKVEPGSILLLSFTRKASREMLSRAERHDPQCKHVEGGTFHSFAYKVLKRYAKNLGFSHNFSILDETEAEDAIARCVAKLNFTEREERFPKKNTLRSIISVSVNKHVSIEEVIKKEYPHFLDYAHDIERLRKAYTEYKINKNYMDYDDLLVYLKLLLENPEIRERVSGKYKYIMVDEYQDTNALQGDITYLLGKDHSNIMAVGDDAQGIYGFRGASHENIMNFPKKFSHCKIIKLEENYRSTQLILNVANTTLENMKNKYSKCLTSMRKEDGVMPELLFFKDAYEEAEWIASKIKDFNDEGLALRDQSVLFRSAYISIPLQAELGKRHIPYQVVGGLRFYETAHVKDVMAHLKIIANPKDELAWRRALMLIKGIGTVTSEKILEEVSSSPSLPHMVDKVLRVCSSRHKYSTALARLNKALKNAIDDNLKITEIYEIFLDYYRPILRDKFDDWHLRINDLETLKPIITRYDSIDEFLADFAIESPEKSVWKVNPSRMPDEQPLTLSTIHSAKGLEWNAVFLMGLMDGVLPVSFALDDEDDIEEEHRLFYVGITRAKDKLFLSMHHEGARGGMYRFNKISQFVDMPNLMSILEVNDISGTEEEIDLDKEELLFP